jgi:hypothetical protein
VTEEIIAASFVEESEGTAGLDESARWEEGMVGWMEITGIGSWVVRLCGRAK